METHVAKTEKTKTIDIAFKPRQFERGEWGKSFYIATFRFPIKEAQAFERRAAGSGFTMASLLSQLVMAFNKSTPEPKTKVKLVRTAKPTLWGNPDEKKSAPKKAKKAKAEKAPPKKPAKVIARLVEKPKKKKMLSLLKKLKSQKEAA